jgi:curved DNA-binding protein CbpA
LTPQEAYLLSRLDSVFDLDSLLKIGGTSRAATCKTLYALLSCGIVEWTKDGAPRASDSRRGLEGLNVEVSAQPPERPPGHAELVKNTYRRIDWLSHYDLLGVRPNAGLDEINQAYFERSRLFHPDLRHREDLARFEKELTAVFERLKIAYDVLSDTQQRVLYDASLSDSPAAKIEASADPTARKQLAYQSYSRARQLIEEKDFHPATEMLREAVRFVPNNGEYRYLLAQVELKNIQWVDRGLENLKEAARLEPRRLEYVREAARALHERGRSEEAKPFAQRLVSLDPTSENQELLNAIVQAAAGQASAPLPPRPPSETLSPPLASPAGRADEAREAFRGALKAIESLPPSRRQAKATLDLEKRVRAALEVVDEKR